MFCLWFCLSLKKVLWCVSKSFSHHFLMFLSLISNCVFLIGSAQCVKVPSSWLPFFVRAANLPFQVTCLTKFVSHTVYVERWEGPLLISSLCLKAAWSICQLLQKGPATPDRGRMNKCCHISACPDAPQDEKRVEHQRIMPGFVLRCACCSSPNTSDMASCLRKEVRPAGDGGSACGVVDLLLKDKWTAAFQSPQRTTSKVWVGCSYVTSLSNKGLLVTETTVINQRNSITAWRRKHSNR